MRQVWCFHRPSLFLLQGKILSRRSEQKREDPKSLGQRGENLSSPSELERSSEPGPVPRLARFYGEYATRRMRMRTRTFGAFKMLPVHRPSASYDSRAERGTC